MIPALSQLSYSTTMEPLTLFVELSLTALAPLALKAATVQDGSKRGSFTVWIAFGQALLAGGG